MSLGEIFTENQSASSSALQSERKSAIPGMFCTPRVRRQKRSKGTTVEETPKAKIKKIDSFFGPGTPRPKEWRFLYHQNRHYVRLRQIQTTKMLMKTFYHSKVPGFNGIQKEVSILERTRNPVIVEENKTKGLVHGSANRTLEQNVEDLIEIAIIAGSSKQQNHLSAMISLVYHIMNNGLLVPMQDLVKKYKEFKGLKESSHLESSRLLEIMSNHLNVAQIYINRKGFIVENHGKEIDKIVKSLQQIGKTDQTIVNL